LLRFDIINYLIAKYDYKDYLEIGVRNAAACFDKIIAPNKTAVDPSFFVRPKGEKDICHEETSDEFFVKNKKLYDIIFIDGMHLYEYVYKDIQNSLNCLNIDGRIILHDCNPILEYHQRPFEEYDGTGIWNGTVWKAFVKYRSHKNLEMITVNTDHGIGCIKRGQQETIDVSEEDLNWNNFAQNRNLWLNLKPLSEDTIECL
jgi:hypothetical protein